MTDEVAALVLRDNYLQGEALSVAEARGAAALDRQTRLIRELEQAGPARPRARIPAGRRNPRRARRPPARRGLTRPELAVLLAYAKMSLDSELLASDLPDVPELADESARLFPAGPARAVRRRDPAHPLRREIIATVVTNDLVNRAGITFIHGHAARTGCGAPEVARAYLIVREVFGCPRCGPRSRRSTTRWRRGCRSRCCSRSPGSSSMPRLAAACQAARLGREIVALGA